MALDGRVAMVTGGASGISRAMARALGAVGAHVWIADVNGEGAAEAVSELRAAGIQADAHDLDVTSRFSVETAVDEITRRAGRLDILFNGAGVVTRRRVLEMAEEDWDRLLAINLRGTFLCSQAAGRVMVEQGYGRIVNIASLTSFVGMMEVAAYTTSKSAVAGLTRALAVEWGPKGVNVNAIAPGVYRTALNTALLDTDRGRELLMRTPLKRYGKVEELQGACVFLSSEAASFVNGEILAVDGGFLASGVNQ